MKYKTMTDLIKQTDISNAVGLDFINKLNVCSHFVFKLPQTTLEYSYPHDDNYVNDHYDDNVDE